MKLKRNLTALAAVTAGLLFFTACGALGEDAVVDESDDADSAEVVPGGLPLAVTTDFSTEVNEEAKALLPDDVTERGAIRVAMGVPYPPFVEYNDKDELIGVDVDMTTALSQNSALTSRSTTSRSSQSFRHCSLTVTTSS